MSSNKQQDDFLKRLAKGLATLFGDNCEVAVHDLRHGNESTIVAIENGHVTGRNVGDGASEIALQAMKSDPVKIQDEYSHLARTKDGRIVKSSSIYLRDKEGRFTYLLGVNYDITDLMMARRSLDAVINVNDPSDNDGINTITSNVNDLLDQLIVEADRHIGIPVAKMSKEEKTRAIQFLNDKGAFLVKKAGDKVSRHYDISKYTLYNYMSAEA